MHNKATKNEAVNNKAMNDEAVKNEAMQLSSIKLKDKNVLVFGAARSGLAAVRLLQRLGAKTVLYDGNANMNIDSQKAGIDTENNFKAIFGEFPEEILKETDLLVISPGIAADHPIAQKCRDLSIPVWGEIELAYRHSKGKIIGITGTNGKTTTTALTGEIMKAWYNEVFVVGNIGNPYTDIALDTTDNSVSVIELSSFQLETIHYFKPDVSAILNITPDHLDRHHTMENYISIKQNITKNQTMSELCVLNYEDEALRSMAASLNTKVTFFSSERRLEKGLYLENDEIWLADEDNLQPVCNVNELKLLGKHNYEDVMAAVSIALAMHVPMDVIRKAIKAFNAVEHRIEYVETIGGVTYYNDSKGTNPDASIKAIKAMKSPIILIGGGYDKGGEFDDWIESFEGRVKLLVLIGQTKEKIAQTAKRHGLAGIIMAESLKEAVRISAQNASAGDAVLLSPACASWDMFENYEQRGRLFKEYVRELMR